MDLRQRKISQEPPTASPAPELLARSATKWANWKLRFRSAVILAIIVASSVFTAHFGVLALNTLIHILVFHELSSLRKLDSTEDLQHSTFFEWSWFIVLEYLVTGFFVFNRFSLDENVGPLFSFLFRYHFFICFAAACFLFVFFISTLTQPYWPRIKSLFWIIITLLILFGTTGPIISALFDALFWYILPTLLIVINDSSAYFSGFFFGRHQLCKISPKKTIEGAVGALIVTVIASWFVAALLANFQFIICPKNNFDLNIWVECNPDPVFLPKEYTIPWIEKSFTCRPVQLHALAYGLFASLIAPFGGLFASAVKRALGIKDFSDLIPGHGGVADRVDCILFGLLFSAVWYFTFVKPYTVSHISFYSQVLPVDDQIMLYNLLKERLLSAGYITK
ncbi:hypothetical protein RCL1_001751 [Eukaryota sp. TZLM3-RCL]